MKKQILFIFAVLLAANSFASIRYVKPIATGTGNGSSWVNASADIQAMINASVSNDQIWVAAGTYLPTQIPFSNNNPTDPRHRTFYVKDSVKIYGGFVGNETLLTQRNWVTNLTVLSGDFNNDDIGFTNNTENAYHVILSVRDSANTIDGFTIKGGNANGTSFNNNLEVETEIVAGANGGGIINYNSNISLNNIIITNNTANNGGGIYNNSSNARISNVTISNNVASTGGGIFCENNSNPTLSYVKLNNNSATNDGGGMFNSSSNPSLSNVIITDNTAGVDGGGINNYASSPSLNNVVFSGNVAGNNGGGMFNTLSSSPVLRNIVISGNTAATGAGISNNSSTPSLINVSIIGNAATSFGGGMQNLNANPFLRNCIVWGNTGGGNQGIDNISSTPTIGYSDIQDSIYAGPGNISTNPLFTNPANPTGADGIWLTADDGLQLSSCTNPCVNTGLDFLGYITDFLDILGNTTNADIRDMGAYEFLATPQIPITISTTDSILYVKKGSTGNGSSWANAIGELGNALNSVYNVSGNVIKQIWVAQGSYTPLFGPTFITCPALLNERFRTFYLKNNVKMYGGFIGTETILTQRNWTSNPTILTGDFNNDDVGFTNNTENAYHVVLSVNDSSTTVLDGFIIKGGNAVQAGFFTPFVENAFINTINGGGINNINSNTSYANMTIIGNAGDVGGGVSNTSDYNTSSNIIFSNTTISGNEAGNGGGIYNARLTGSPANIYIKLTLNNTTISGNSAYRGGGIYSYFDTIKLSNVIISDNTAYKQGGGVASDASNQNFNNVTISNNSTSLPENSYGGGMYIISTEGQYAVFNSSLNNVIINNNSSYYGGGVYINADSSNISLSNVTISNNSSGSRGGGIYISGNTNTSLSKVIIKNNTASNYGGGMYNQFSNPSLSNVSIINNAVTGIVFPPFVPGGGGICNVTANPSLNNVIISGNTTNGWGGGMCSFSNSNPILSNVTVSGNSAIFNGAGMANFNDTTYPVSKPILKNTIVWGNTGGGFKGIYNSNNATTVPIITYSNIQDSLYSGIGNISSDPLFTNATYPVGADSILLTADDGLQLSCASPCINTGTNTGTPVLDILGNGIFGGIKDMGAYEIQSSSSTTLASNNQTTLQNVNNNIFTATSCILIAKVVPNSTVPVVGNVTAKVWIDATQNNQFVKRHYEISPATNTATSTARVTLYFTQTEFDNFNAVNTIKLPTGNADVTGKANLLIEKRSGTGDANGTFSSYTGSITNINPADSNIIWNAAAIRWEVSFDVTGFSGFWVKTQSGTLPLTLLSFTAQKVANDNIYLQWNTTNEINTAHFDIEFSNDATNFSTIGQVVSANTSGNHNYNFTHISPQGTSWYYRLKQVDKDGKFTYSEIRKLTNTKNTNKTYIAPNPVADVLNIIEPKLTFIKTIEVYDSKGALIMQKMINREQQQYQLPVSNLSKGNYVLKIIYTNDVKHIRFIK